MVSAIEAFVYSAVAWFLYQWYSFRRNAAKVSHIPTQGSDWFLGSYIDSWKYILHGQSIVKDGYRKYKGAVFKVPVLLSPSGYLIIASGDDLIEDMRKAPADVLSFAEGAIDSLQTDQLFQSHARANQFHIPVVRTPLTRSYGDRFDDITDEIASSCETYLPGGDDWEAPPKTHEALTHIICRTSNRFFVGLPICREPEYMKVQEDWAIHVILGGYALHLTPWFLKPVVGPFVTKLPSARKTVVKYLGPIIEERIAKDEKYGPNWDGKPADLITWLLQYAPAKNRNVEDVTTRLMFANFAAIHTTTMSLSNVLFNLAARQEYIQPLREEIETAIRANGWTKEAMGHMHKLDSFIKESMRLAGIINVAVQRKALKDFTFSNGVTIPAGFTVAAAANAIHTDPEIYEDPESFKGFRFCHAEEEDGNSEEVLRHHAVAMDPSYLVFGHGRNACPGRFFAVNEVKAVISHVLLNYDIKLPGDATEPLPGMWFAGSQAPNPAAQILFRKRHWAQQ